MEGARRKGRQWKETVSRLIPGPLSASLFGRLQKFQVPSGDQSCLYFLVTSSPTTRKKLRKVFYLKGTVAATSWRPAPQVVGTRQSLVLPGSPPEILNNWEETLSPPASDERGVHIPRGRGILGIAAPWGGLDPRRTGVLKIIPTFPLETYVFFLKVQDRYLQIIFMGSLSQEALPPPRTGKRMRQIGS